MKTILANVGTLVSVAAVALWGGDTLLDLLGRDALLPEAATSVLWFAMGAAGLRTTQG